MITKSERLLLVQWLIETNDEEAISRVKKIKDESAVLTEAQEAVLSQRIKRYRAGEMKFSSWTDVKNRIKANG